MAVGEQLLDAYYDFISSPIDQHLHHRADDKCVAQCLELFHNTAKEVPAYSAFLADNGLDPCTVSSQDQFRTVPPVTRSNYLTKYPLTQLCRNGSLESCDMIAVSSGSTGSPTFWPRNAADEIAISWRFEQIFHDSFHADTRRTLAVVCFALGTWVGGMYTAACCRHLAGKGYPITTITPGNNRDEIFRVIKDLSPQYDQTVLLGYPPFLKDIIDTGAARGIDWKSFGIKLVMAGEVFSEEWRHLVAERLGIESGDLPAFAASMYGTADAGVLGVETPLSVSIRRYLSQNPLLARDIFGESRLPTLVQYDPASRYFESYEGRLLFTGNNGVPLIRYDILDTGGIIGFEELLGKLEEHGFNSSLSGSRVRNLPFVYVFGRSNFTVSYFGANIFPENVSVGLEQPGIKEWTTGKFVLETFEDEGRSLRLRVTVEMAPDEQADDIRTNTVAASIRHHLERLNSEFVNYTPSEFRTPYIELKSCGDAEYFPVGNKHRYTRSTSKL